MIEARLREALDALAGARLIVAQVAECNTLAVPILAKIDAALSATHEGENFPTGSREPWPHARPGLGVASTQEGTGDAQPNSHDAIREALVERLKEDQSDAAKCAEVFIDVHKDSPWPRLAKNLSDAIAALQSAPVEPSLEGWRTSFANELRKWWSFDDGQHHTHSWHTREDFIARTLPILLAGYSPHIPSPRGLTAAPLERSGDALAKAIDELEPGPVMGLDLGSPEGDRTHITLPKDVYDAFVEALTADAVPLDKLKQLLQSRSPWDALDARTIERVARALFVHEHGSTGSFDPDRARMWVLTSGDYLARAEVAIRALASPTTGRGGNAPAENQEAAR